ncbi:MAG TPA: ATP-binding protein [Micromonosporaceae bacterium]|nr:ATP-binding protein [Micromonosporaceae bacterium]
MVGISGELRPPRRVPGVVLAGAVAVVGLVLLGQWLDDQAVPLRSVSLTAAIGVLVTPMAALVLAGAPGHLVGRLMFAAGAVSCASVLAASWASLLPLAWLTQWSGWPPLGLIVLTLLVFPDGRLPSPRWRPLAILIATAVVVASVALAVAALDHPRDLLTSTQHPVTPRAQLFKLVAKAAILVVGAALVAVLWSLWQRWRRAGGDVRQQLACLLAAGVLFPLALVLDVFDLPSIAWVLAAAVIPVAMTVAVLQYRLYDADRIINRTIVWLVMTFLVVVGFVAIVALLRDRFLGADASNASLVATGLIAVAFEPVRRRVQHGVERMIYGDRDDPYKVISTLGDVHSKTTDPDAVLPLLAGTIARSMRVPYVAVELTEHGSPRISAEYGRHTPAMEQFDMVAHGQRLGRLLVGTRSFGERFTRDERGLLAGVAQYAAAMTEATRLIRDLQDSRGRLITAREEERRRLRRDLHDGVGPALTGLSMQVRAARKCIGQPARVSTILDGVAADLKLCASEVRQLLDGLPRPAELDHGLQAALLAYCRRFDNPPLSVELNVVDDLDGLPAAVEVAAYRIVTEALTNVAKHARARTCQVTVSRRDTLSLEILDDGIGIEATPAGQRGVGLDSMRERAAELGGECVFTDRTLGGTAVWVSLPIPAVPQPDAR